MKTETTGYTLEEFQSLLGDSIDIRIDDLKHNKIGLYKLLHNAIVKFGYVSNGEERRVVLCSRRGFIYTYFKGIGMSSSNITSRMTKLDKAEKSCVNTNRIASMDIGLCHYGTYPIEKWWIESFLLLEKKNAELINEFLISINKNWKLIKTKKKK